MTDRPIAAPKPNTYGFDVSTFVENDEGAPDLDPYFTLISGNDVLGEQLLRGITMEKGEMWDSPDEGYDVRKRVSDRFDQRGVKAAQLGGLVQSEIDGDERVEFAEVKIGFNASDRSLTLDAQVTPSLGGPFALRAEISAVTVELISP